jgi:hypothetical protein
MEALVAQMRAQREQAEGEASAARQALDEVRMARHHNFAQYPTNTVQIPHTYRNIPAQFYTNLVRFRTFAYI